MKAPILLAALLLAGQLAVAQCNTPPPTGVSMQRFCGGSQVARLLATGTDIKWYDTETSTEPLSASEYLTTFPDADYYATQTTDGCESTLRFKVQITTYMNDVPTPGFDFTTTWKAISSSEKNHVAIKTDGTLWGWGFNHVGQVGDGTTTDRQTPVQVGLEFDWAMAVAGLNQTFAIKNNGTLWAWGSNTVGQLGDGTTASKHVPVQIGTDSNWKFIATYNSHTLAIKTDGTLWSWGVNTNGELGIGNFVNQLSPVQLGDESDWATVATGLQHTLALKTNGTLWGWGNNQYSVLTDEFPATSTFSEPVMIKPDTDWKSITSASICAFGIKQDGSLWGWGSDVFGELADGESPNDSYYRRIGTENTWVNVSLRGVHEFNALAIKSDGSLWAWGNNKYGALGNRNRSDTYQKTPVRVGTENDWATISTGHQIQTAIKHDGTLWIWGHTSYRRDTNDESSEYEPTLLSAPDGLAIQPFCPDATVADLIAKDTEIQWYDSPTGPYPLANDTRLVHGTFYYGTQRSGGCESFERLQAVALLNSKDVARPVGVAAQEFCNSGTLADITVTGNDIRWYSAPEGGNAMPGTTALQSEALYYATQSILRCESRSRLAVTTSILTPAPPTGDNVQHVISELSLMHLQVTGTGIKWYDQTGLNDRLNPLPINTPLVFGSTYYATQTVSGCESTDALAVRVEMVTGVDEISKPISVYPNPVAEQLHIVHARPIKSISVFDSMGRPVNIGTAERDSNILDLRTLSRGTYIVRIVSDKTVQFRFVKQ